MTFFNQSILGKKLIDLKLDMNRCEISIESLKKSIFKH